MASFVKKRRMRMDDYKRDKDYKKVVELLNDKYGWKHFDHNKGLFKALSGMGVELVSDTIKATKDLRKS